MTDLQLPSIWVMNRRESRTPLGECCCPHILIVPGRLWTRTCRFARTRESSLVSRHAIVLPTIPRKPQDAARIQRGKRHPHCLKHSLGVTLVESNVNLAVIEQALGHKSIASTAIYTVPTDESTGKAVLGALASAF